MLWQPSIRVLTGLLNEHTQKVFLETQTIDKSFEKLIFQDHSDVQHAIDGHPYQAQPFKDISIIK